MKTIAEAAAAALAAYKLKHGEPMTREQELIYMLGYADGAVFGIDRADEIFAERAKS